MKDSFEKKNEFLSVFFLFIILIAMFGFFFGEKTKAIFLKANYYTLLPIAKIIGERSDADITVRNIQQIRSVDEVNWRDIWKITEVTGSYTRWLVAASCLAWIFFLYRKDFCVRFAKKLTLKDLMARNARLFYATRPVIGENLLDKKTYKGPWAPALSPLEFALGNGILEMEGKDLKEVRKYIQSLYKKRVALGDALVGEFVKCTFNADRARYVFSSQLGDVVSGLKGGPESAEDILEIVFKMEPHKRALLTVFLCHYIAEDNLKEEGMKFLEQFADSYYIEKLKKEKKKKEWTVNALNIDGVDDKIRNIINKYDIDKILVPFYFHAHSNVIMASVFKHVKTIVSSDFIWLKPVDRTLWYVLNSVGRKTPFSEAAGVFSHYNMEVAVGRPIIDPDVDAAVKALEDALRNEGWIK